MPDECMGGGGGRGRIGTEADPAYFGKGPRERITPQSRGENYTGGVARGRAHLQITEWERSERRGEVRKRAGAASSGSNNS